MLRLSTRCLALLGICYFGMLCSPSFSQNKPAIINASNSNFVANHKVQKALIAPSKYSGKAAQSMYVKDIFQAKNGTFYLSNFTDLLTYDEAEDHWVRIETSTFGNLSMKTIVQDFDNRLWMISDILSRLSVFDGRVWGTVEFEDESSFGTTAIFPSKNKSLWAVTCGKLRHFDNDKWSDAIDATDLILKAKAGDINQGIQDSDGLIWLSIRNGLLQYDEAKGEWA